MIRQMDDRNRRFNGGMTAEQFLFREIRITAPMFLSGMSMEEALRIVRSQQLFMYPTERMISRMVRACWRRLEALCSEDLVRGICESPSYVSKQINLYAIMRYNSLARSFMIELIGDKFRRGDLVLTKRDVNAFFSDLQASDSSMAAWSDATIKKLKSVFVKMLVETDHLDSAKSEMLKPILISAELKRGIIENADEDALVSFNCFR